MNGFFSPDALAQLQEAYALQLDNPEDQDIDATTGLPTGVVSNTSPWHGQMPLWKYPDGKNPLETAPLMFDPKDAEDEYEEEEYDEEEVDDEQGEGPEAEMTEEEVDALIQELLESDDDEE